MTTLLKNSLELTDYINKALLNEVAMVAFLDGFNYRAGNTYEPPGTRDFDKVIDRGIKNYLNRKYKNK